MANPIERRRLKKKMLDRWENEGGRIAGDPAATDDNRPTNEHDGKGKQPLASADNTTVGGPSSSTKRRKATRK